MAAAVSDAPEQETRFARRDILIGGACCFGAVLGGSTSVWNRPSSLPAGGLAALVPTRIGGWSLAGTGGVVVAEDGAEPTGPYDDLLTRIYESLTAPPVTLLIAYVGSQQADLRLHRPEACYPAAGYALSQRELVTLQFTGTPKIAAQMIFAESAMRAEQLLYWTRVGTEFPTSNMAQVAAFLRSNLSGRVPDGVLVRISVPDRDRARARVAFQAFLAALLARSSPAAARFLFGGAGPEPVRAGHHPVAETARGRRE